MEIPAPWTLTCVISLTLVCDVGSLQPLFGNANSWIKYLLFDGHSRIYDQERKTLASYMLCLLVCWPFWFWNSYRYRFLLSSCDWRSNMLVRVNEHTHNDIVCEWELFHFTGHYLKGRLSENVRKNLVERKDNWTTSRVLSTKQAWRFTIVVVIWQPYQLGRYSLQCQLRSSYHTTSTRDRRNLILSRRKRSSKDLSNALMMMSRSYAIAAPWKVS
jgi:hypothetical protein